MAAKVGSFRHSFAEKSKERLLSRTGNNYSDFGGSDGGGGGGGGGAKFRCLRFMSDGIINLWNNLQNMFVQLYEMGRSDPRKFVFAAKMGLSLALVSLVIFFKQPLKNVSQYAIWAILTVVVVFEFSVGATLNKGFNRALGTFSAGGLALAIAEISLWAGKFEEVIIVISIFIAGFCASYAKLHPTMKPYEYGFRVFLLTYCIVLMSTSKAFFANGIFSFDAYSSWCWDMFGCEHMYIPHLVRGRSAQVGVEKFQGVLLLLWKVVLRDIWSALNTRGFRRKFSHTKLLMTRYTVAIDQLFNLQAKRNLFWTLQYGSHPTAVTKGFNYPWRNYVKVGGALRHCAFMVMAMHGCILSEIQAPPEKRQVFRSELQRVGTEGAKVLRELGSKVEKMEKLSSKDILLEVHEAAEELQMKIDQNSYILVNYESWPGHNRPKDFDAESFMDAKENESKNLVISSLSEMWDAQNSVMGLDPSMSELSSDNVMRKQPVSWPRLSFTTNAMLNEQESKVYESASSLSLATFSSLLIEFVARLQNLVDEFDELSQKANFIDPVEQSDRAKEVAGFWTTLLRRLPFISRKPDLVSSTL